MIENPTGNQINQKINQKEFVNSIFILESPNWNF